MKHMSLQEITAACHGQYFGGEAVSHIEVTGVAIDSRKIEKDWLFIPIKGARVDGHSFIPQVMEKVHFAHFRSCLRECISPIHSC